MPTMNVSITDEIESFVAEKVAAGQYNNASEVVRAALRMMREEDLYLAWLRKEVQIGLDDIDAGRVQPFTKELVKEINAEGRRRLRERKKESA
ncbi:MAG: type II toxin-antitoxin system ParD family antitoxin [Fimbriimonadales bacterium]